MNPQRSSTRRRHSDTGSRSSSRSGRVAVVVFVVVVVAVAVSGSGTGSGSGSGNKSSRRGICRSSTNSSRISTSSSGGKPFSRTSRLCD